MSQHDEFDERRAALIDQRIGQAFGFLGDVIEDSRLLEVIPDGSRLAFRDVTIGGMRFRLTAFQSPEARDRWSALVTGFGGANAPDGSKTNQMQALIEGTAGTESATATTGKTAALALEAELRSLVTLPA